MRQHFLTGEEEEVDRREGKPTRPDGWPHATWQSYPEPSDCYFVDHGNNTNTSDLTVYLKDSTPSKARRGLLKERQPLSYAELHQEVARPQPVRRDVDANGMKQKRSDEPAGRGPRLRFNRY